MAKSKSAASAAVVPATSAAVVPATVTSVTAESVVPVVDMTPLAKARNAVATVVGKTGEVIKAYATMLDGLFDVKDINGKVVCKWYDLKGRERKGLKAEQDTFLALIKSKNFAKNVEYSYWMRVKEASGWISAAKVKGSTDIDAKTLAEITTIINRINGALAEGKVCNKSEDVLDKLMDIFSDLGGDEEKLK